MAPPGKIGLNSLLALETEVVKLDLAVIMY